MYLLEFLDGGLLQLSWWQLIVAALVLTHITIASVTIFLHAARHTVRSIFIPLWRCFSESGYG